MGSKFLTRRVGVSSSIFKLSSCPSLRLCAVASTRRRMLLTREMEQMSTPILYGEGRGRSGIPGQDSVEIVMKVKMKMWFEAENVDWERERGSTRCGASVAQSGSTPQT